MWRASSELSGYAQQDAHECFISALNQIHATSRGKTELSCICIVHSTFDGLLQSDVKCKKCGNVTTATDPMLDISLELKSKVGGIGQDYTLASCLRRLVMRVVLSPDPHTTANPLRSFSFRFTQPEELAATEYSCDKCGRGSVSSGMTI